MWKHKCKQRELSNCAKMGKENKEKAAARQKNTEKKNNLIAKRDAAFRAYARKRAPWLVVEFDKEFDVGKVSYIDSKFIVNSILNIFCKTLFKQNSDNEEQPVEKTTEHQEPVENKTTVIGELLVRKIRKFHEKRKKTHLF